MLSLLYIAVLIIGLVVIAWGVLGLSGAFTLGAQSQTDAAGQVLRLVPVAVGAGMAVFGAVGLVIDRLTPMEPTAGIITALGAGVLVGFAVQAALYYRLLQTLAALPPPPDVTMGQTAEVVITIPGNGIGQIAYQSKGQTTQMGASSGTYQTIPKGSVVVIEEIVRRVAKVRPA